MKLGTPRHPKFIHLRRLLKTSLRETVGILELLWQFTMEYAHRGDIGRWTNREIADACDWKGQPEKLVRGLVGARWLDSCAKYRLVVHDWQDHCPSFIRKRITRAINKHKSGKGPFEPGFAVVGRFDPEKVREPAADAVPLTAAAVDPTAADVRTTAAAGSQGGNPGQPLADKKRTKAASGRLPSQGKPGQGEPCPQQGEGSPCEESVGPTENSEAEPKKGPQLARAITDAFEQLMSTLYSPGWRNLRKPKGAGAFVRQLSKDIGDGRLPGKEVFKIAAETRDLHKRKRLSTTLTVAFQHAIGALRDSLSGPEVAP